LTYREMVRKRKTRNLPKPPRRRKGEGGEQIPEYLNKEGPIVLTSRVQFRGEGPHTKAEKKRREEVSPMSATGTLTGKRGDNRPDGKEKTLPRAQRGKCATERKTSNQSELQKPHERGTPDNKRSTISSSAT